MKKDEINNEIVSKSIVHSEAMFAYWNKGDRRSLAEVGKMYNVSAATVMRWRNKEGWETEIHRIEAEIAKDIRQQTIMKRVSLQEDITQFARTVLDQFKKEFMLAIDNGGKVFIAIDQLGNTTLNHNLFKGYMTLAVPLLTEDSNEDVRKVIILPEQTNAPVIKPATE
jgi:uncharacterized protein YjcR